MAGGRLVNNRVTSEVVRSSPSKTIESVFASGAEISDAIWRANTTRFGYDKEVLLEVSGNTVITMNNAGKTNKEYLLKHDYIAMSGNKRSLHY